MDINYIIVTLVRLSVPLSILRWPLLGTVASAYLDYRDWDFLGVNTNSEMIFYQNWDKILDIYYLALAWYVSLSFKDKVARAVSSFLFFYRGVGVIAAFIFDRSLLLFFPNIFEWFFLFYVLFLSITKRQVLFSSYKVLAIVLLSIAIPKLAQEYFMHFIRKFPWEVFDVSHKLGIDKFLPGTISWSFWLWIGMFSSLPLAALFWTIKYAGRQKNS